MSKSATKFERMKRHFPAAVRLAGGFLCLLWLAGFVAGVAGAADIHGEGGAAPARGLPFAVADFDGDLRPDLASVEVGRSDFFGTDYWIHLQLSAIGRQTILVVAPAGGIQISARDVNGDDALDLVLTTRWLKQPVAILLNDGHGGFSRADNGAYPEAFGESSTNWDSTSDRFEGALGVPQQQRADISLDEARRERLRSRTGCVPLFRLGFLRNPAILFPQSRAPPFELS
jgi:hypothetical protein